MVKGRVDRKASTATGYAWFVWEKNAEMAHPRLYVGTTVQARSRNVLRLLGRVEKLV